MGVIHIRPDCFCVEVLFCVGLTGFFARQEVHPFESRTEILTTCDTPRESSEQAPNYYQFSKLTLEEARKLNGRRVTVRTRLVSFADSAIPQFYYDCSGSSTDLTRSVQFGRGEEPIPNQIKDETTVTGRLMLINHPESTDRGRVYKAYTEIRLADANRVNH
jgi:hypothetical protein